MMPLTAICGVSPEVLHALERKYGKKGAAAFAVFRRGEADLEAYAKRFDRYYKSGRIGLSFDQIPAELISESSHLAKVAFDAGVRDAKEKTLSGFTSTKSMGYPGKIIKTNVLPEEPLSYHESQAAPHDTDRSKSSLEGAVSLIDIMNDINKVTNADETIQIIKGTDISKWAETST